jgi:hypothetical protein
VLAYLKTVIMLPRNFADKDDELYFCSGHWNSNQKKPDLLRRTANASLNSGNQILCHYFIFANSTVQYVISFIFVAVYGHSIILFDLKKIEFIQNGTLVIHANLLCK